MANIKVTKHLTELVSKIKQCQPSDVTDSQIGTYLVGRLIGYKTPLPSMEVAAPVESWYIENCTATVMDMIGEINEAFTLDVEGTLMMTRAIWRMRYNLLHVSQSEEATHQLDVMMSSGNDKLPVNITNLVSETRIKLSNELSYHTKELANALTKSF
jgi:hypothetical protein